MFGEHLESVILRLSNSVTIRQITISAFHNGQCDPIEPHPNQFASFFDDDAITMARTIRHKWPCNIPNANHTFRLFRVRFVAKAVVKLELIQARRKV